MKRVLFVDHVDRILGGAEINLVELLEHWETSKTPKWQVAVACAPSSPLYDRLSSLPVELLPHSFDSSLNQLRVVGRIPTPWGMALAWMASRRAAAKLRHQILTWKPSAVVSCANKDHFCAASACAGLNVPLVWWVNDIINANFFPWLFRTLYFQKARKAQRLVPVSEFARQALLDSGVANWKAVTVLNGIPTDRYSHSLNNEDQNSTLQSELGIRDDMGSVNERPVVIGLIGRFTPWKGQLFFLELAKQWIESGRPPATFVLIGKSFNEDQSYEAELRQFVEDNPLLKPHVRFVPFQSRIEKALAQIDILAHTSIKPEPFGRTIIEAMAMGVPPIAAKSGGVTEIITHKQDGWLATPGNHQSYLDGLDEMINNPEQRKEMGEMAAKTVRERFDVSRTLSQFDEIFDSIGSNMNSGSAKP